MESLKATTGKRSAAVALLGKASSKQWKREKLASRSDPPIAIHDTTNCQSSNRKKLASHGDPIVIHNIDNETETEAKDGPEELLVDDQECFLDEEALLTDGLENIIGKREHFSRHIMGISGNHNAREIAKPFALRACRLVCKHNVCEESTGPHSKDMTAPKMKTSNNSVIYDVLSEDLSETLKSGCAANWSHRQQKHIERGNAPEHQRVVVDLDLTSQELNDEMEELHSGSGQFLASMQDEQNGLHPFQRHRFEFLGRATRRQTWIQQKDLAPAD